MGKSTNIVEFNHGKVHEYGGVPPEMDQNRKDADPQGSYFAQNINIKGVSNSLSRGGQASYCWPAGLLARKQRLRFSIRLRLSATSMISYTRQ